MLQAQRFVEAGLLLVDVERRHLRRVEHGEPIHRDLDLAGSELGVGGAFGPMPHRPLNLDDPLVPRRLRRGVGLSGLVGVRDHLRDPVAIPQVEEGEVAMVAPAMHPARKRDALADVLGTQLATGMGTEAGAHGSGHGSRSPAAIMARR